MLKKRASEQLPLVVGSSHESSCVEFLKGLGYLVVAPKTEKVSLSIPGLIGLFHDEMSSHFSKREIKPVNYSKSDVRNVHNLIVMLRNRGVSYKEAKLEAATIIRGLFKFYSFIGLRSIDSTDVLSDPRVVNLVIQEINNERDAEQALFEKKIDALFDNSFADPSVQDRINNRLKEVRKRLGLHG